jgi:hypothetical protein
VVTVAGSAVLLAGTLGLAWLTYRRWTRLLDKLEQLERGP